MRKSAIAMLIFLGMLVIVSQTVIASGLYLLLGYGKNTNTWISITQLLRKLITQLQRKLITQLLRLRGCIIESIEAKGKSVQGRPLITTEAENFGEHCSFKHCSLEKKCVRVDEQVKVPSTLSDALRHCLNAESIKQVGIQLNDFESPCARRLYQISLYH
jgi:hypothetical protein